MRFMFGKRMLFLLIFAKSLENAHDLPMILKFQGSHYTTTRDFRELQRIQTSAYPRRHYTTTRDFRELQKLWGTAADADGHRCGGSAGHQQQGL